MTDKTYLSQIETPTDSYVTVYPWAVDMAIKQQSLFWPAEELGVEEDEQDFRVNLLAGELHGIIYAQSVLTQYELMIGGDEFWGGRIAKLFPRPEIQRMCACFSNVELNSHAPFYAIGNEVLGKATDEFYTQWKLDPILAKRMKFITKCSQSENALEVAAALTFLEGAVLFSIFGFFKGFNSRGFNLIPHFVAGIDGSTKDENFHSIAGANLFKQCKAERMELGNHSKRQETALNKKIDRMARDVYEHELLIINEMYSVGENRVTKKQESIEFLEDRLNIVLARLDRPPMFERKLGVISGWFYQQLSSVKIPDFFAATQLQYTRNWARHKLGFNRNLVKEVSA